MYFIKYVSFQKSSVISFGSRSFTITIPKRAISQVRELFDPLEH